MQLVHIDRLFPVYCELSSLFTFINRHGRALFFYRISCRDYTEISGRVASMAQVLWEKVKPS